MSKAKKICLKARHDSDLPVFYFWFMAGPKHPPPIQLLKEIYLCEKTRKSKWHLFQMCLCKRFGYVFSRYDYWFKGNIKIVRLSRHWHQSILFSHKYERKEDEYVGTSRKETIINLTWSIGTINVAPQKQITAKKTKFVIICYSSFRETKIYDSCLSALLNIHF